MKLRRYIPILALPLLLTLGIALLSGIFGVHSSKLEEDARFSHKIDDDWSTATGQSSDDMAAMLFYSPEKDDFSYSIYVNRPGFSFGYFFRVGGSTAEVEQAISEFSVEGFTSRAYVSMNTQRIARVEFGDDSVLTLNPNEPFAIVVPADRGSISFYNENGEWIEPIPRRL